MADLGGFYGRPGPGGLPAAQILQRPNSAKVESATLDARPQLEVEAEKKNPKRTTRHSNLLIPPMLQLRCPSEGS